MLIVFWFFEEEEFIQVISSKEDFSWEKQSCYKSEDNDKAEEKLYGRVDYATEDLSIMD